MSSGSKRRPDCITFLDKKEYSKNEGIGTRTCQGTLVAPKNIHVIVCVCAHTRVHITIIVTFVSHLYHESISHITNRALL